ncbi:hypothetical protein D9613_004681 [Agrocybe pediades]|uniref:chitin synthase n=1 Tax=Agrocybe pediades TaxID=84607 RepID=A0A8H4QZI7_9AGAR|nr:hypothetical protein D9613_004681 [Agrocybe pediades]
MATSTQTTQAVSTGDLLTLVSSTGSAIIYPSDDTLLAVLQSRFRADLPYTRIGTSHLVAVNPYKTLASVNDASAKEYEEREYAVDTTGSTSGARELQPHLYDVAAKIYLLMRRRGESQGVIVRGITGSGKSTSLQLLTSQLLRLSTPTKKSQKLSSQITALQTVLTSFGHAKTLMSPNASRHSRYLELHFTPSTGVLASAKVLTYALDKSRLNKLTHEERTYHVFYQFLAGATPSERDAFNLEDPSDYALLASSGCYRLPSGPFSDDAIAMTELRAAMRVLGFKSKHLSAIFSILVSILLLGNLEFGDADANDVSAHVVNRHILEHAARLLGVPAEEMEGVLTNKTSYVRKEVFTVLLGKEQSARQRDGLVRDLYAILFAFVTETCNHRLAAPTSSSESEGQAPLPSPTTQIVLLDQPGFQTRGPSGTLSQPLLGTSAYGTNSFDEFCINFSDELVHSYVLRHVFEDSLDRQTQQMKRDGLALPEVSIMDNSACVELLRGAGLGEWAQVHSKKSSGEGGGVVGVLGKACAGYKQGKRKSAGSAAPGEEDSLLKELQEKFGVHSSFVAPSSSSSSNGGSPFMPEARRQFGINHYAGSASYDASQFVEKDADLVDAAFVSLFRASTDSFIVKLFSGPSLAAERHSKDEGIVVQAQVSSRPLRAPSRVAAPAELGFEDQDEPSREEDEQAQHPRLDPSKTYPVTTQLNFALSEIFSALNHTKLTYISCLRPNDSSSPNSFDKRRVKAQLRSLLLTDIVKRVHSKDWVVSLPKEGFCARYVPTMRGSEQERIGQCARANGWAEGREYCVGEERVWLGWKAWKEVEDGVRVREGEGQEREGGRGPFEEEEYVGEEGTEYTHGEHGLVPPPGGGGLGGAGYFGDSADNLLGYGAGGLRTPTMAAYGGQTGPGGGGQDVWSAEDGDKEMGSSGSPEMLPYSSSRGAPGSGPPGGGGTGGMTVKESHNAVEEVPSTKSRRWWLRLVWLTTWWIPSFLLRVLGRMKRPDVRLAWREKVTIFWLIFLFNGVIIFYIIEFGRLLCPNFDKAWSIGEVNQHQGQDDYWVAVQGYVYDVTNFIHGDHSKGQAPIKSNSPDVLEVMAGQDLTYWFPPPLVLGCSGLVKDPQMGLSRQNWTDFAPLAHHTSGALQSSPGDLQDPDWYSKTFFPKMKTMRKGPLVVERKVVAAMAADDSDPRVIGIYNTQVFDITDYVFTLEQSQNNPSNAWMDEDLVAVFTQRSGQDITKALDAVYASMDPNAVSQHKTCLENVFLAGQADFRKSARCQVQNYLLIIMSVILMLAIALKFLAALQLGTKRNPENQDKFVICQVPCYTEGEDSLRRTIDSLAALNYDDKRKLIFIICDGNIIGSGNDRTTPRIVLDILGVDPGLDPEPLLFKSIGEGSKAINYAKVYSGLYEFEGHVVPYMVVVKVGKPTERSKPGNRGKRDSQILVMHYLNRVHFDSAMSPLELEIYHQMRNVIGIDPAFYEYIFTVDADTTVTPDALNRLVASSADDSQIIGICGETKLTNEEGSWWTMIQVYEYYISHHLSKAFESLFGSVTCLPGCFSLYRIRTADKGRPIIISNRIIEEYSEPNVDTLHKKNLFSLGEDRFLTTLLMKHFPTFKTKFCPDAVAHTMAPESWRILFSQRRRWINSTVHNLCELVLLPELFGFCCFSMRFFVFIDLIGTLMLPATCVYLLYLIIVVATGKAALPTIALIMLGVTYGLQAFIFIIKREFMLVGWLVVYLISYPVYSFFLPVYSFWCMDEFSWGNTRVVLGEGKDKKVITNDDEKFDESMIPLKKFSEYEAEAWETNTHRSDDTRSRSGAGPRSRDESPHTYNHASQSGDYYRDTNMINANGSNPNLRNLGGGGSQLSHSNVSQHGGQPPMLPPMSQYGMPQLPLFMPMGGGSGPPSIAGSEYGYSHMMNMQPAQPVGGLYAQNTGSVYGMMPPMMPPMMTGMSGGGLGMGGMSMFGNGSMSGSQSGGAFGMQNAPQQPSQLGQQSQTRPMSTFSMATSVNPFAGPSMNPNPSDEEVFNALRNYLSTQDLMSVTKKTAREAIMVKFPKADLASRKEFLNQSIDKILSES